MAQYYFLSITAVKLFYCSVQIIINKFYRKCVNKLLYDTSFIQILSIEICTGWWSFDVVKNVDNNINFNIIIPLITYNVHYLQRRT